MHRVCLAAALILFIQCVSLHAQEKNSPASSVAATDNIEFELQGEYLGEIETDEGRQPAGVQVIALGDRKFRAVGYAGGLPGQGWKRGDAMHTAEAELVGNSVQFKGEHVTAILTPGSITLESSNKKPWVLKKLVRKSPTLEQKPPAGAIVLFDGSSADKFENGKLVEGNLLAASNCASKLKLQDHTLHIEFRTPFMPKARGQGRGNSGVYVQGRYEVQVLDSFGLEGKNNECGGIYTIAEPKINMCFPPLSWQTYDIDFTSARYDSSGKKTQNARITVRHNGIVIHDNVELAKGTPGRHPEGPAPDALFLQDHGNPVVFRNIWIVEKKSVEAK